MPVSGGVARDGWYMIGIGKKKLLRDGVPGTAVIKDFTWMGEASNVGNAQHDFTLEITLDGKPPYELQGLFRIPVRLIERVTVGMTVPVKVRPDNPKKAAIDWDAWEAGRNAPST
jgi:hypothetical protein